MIGTIYFNRKKRDMSFRRAMVVYLMVALGVLLIGLAAAALTRGYNESVSFVEVTIEQGDTVWSKVRSIYGEGIDIRGIVDETIAMNNLKSKVLMSGMVLMIPVSEVASADSHLTSAR
jgi:hypothetical protein